MIYIVLIFHKDVKTVWYLHWTSNTLDFRYSIWSNFLYNGTERCAWISFDKIKSIPNETTWVWAFSAGYGEVENVSIVTSKLFHLQCVITNQFSLMYLLLFKANVTKHKSLKNWINQFFPSFFLHGRTKLWLFLSEFIGKTIAQFVDQLNPKFDSKNLSVSNRFKLGKKP